MSKCFSPYFIPFPAKLNAWIWILNIMPHLKTATKHFFSFLHPFLINTAVIISRWLFWISFCIFILIGYNKSFQYTSTSKSIFSNCHLLSWTDPENLNGWMGGDWTFTKNNSQTFHFPRVHNFLKLENYINTNTRLYSFEFFVLFASRRELRQLPRLHFC